MISTAGAYALYDAVANDQAITRTDNRLSEAGPTRVDDSAEAETSSMSVSDPDQQQQNPGQITQSRGNDERFSGILSEDDDMDADETSLRQPPPAFTAVSAGEAHLCGLRTGGDASMFCKSGFGVGS